MTRRAQELDRKQFADAPRLALARAVTLGLMPAEALGYDAAERLQDAARVDHWRLPALVD